MITKISHQETAIQYNIQYNTNRTHHSFLTSVFTHEFYINDDLFIKWTKTEDITLFCFLHMMLYNTRYPFENLHTKLHGNLLSIYKVNTIRTHAFYYRLLILTFEISHVYTIQPKHITVSSFEISCIYKVNTITYIFWDILLSPNLRFLLSAFSSLLMIQLQHKQNLLPSNTTSLFDTSHVHDIIYTTHMEYIRAPSSLNV